MVDLREVTQRGEVVVRGDIVLEDYKSALSGCERWPGCRIEPFLRRRRKLQIRGWAVRLFGCSGLGRSFWNLLAIACPPIMLTAAMAISKRTDQLARDIRCTSCWLVWNKSKPAQTRK